MKWFKRGKAKSNSSDFVRVMDIGTQTISRIPARELAPNMVEVRMEGVEGLVWVDARELKQGGLRHPPFDEDVRGLLREIQSLVGEFYNLSVEEWEDGFRRDTTPEREIALWLHFGGIYRSLTHGRGLSREQRHDIFRIMVACMNGGREHVLKVAPPSVLPAEEANQAIAAFYASASESTSE